MTERSLAQRDLNALWHPCTQMKEHEAHPPIPIKSGQGVFLNDFSGNRYIDAISSWWVNLFGHCHPKISAAIKEQADTLEHAIFAGFSHEPGIALAERLLQIAPPGLARCFYGDNGSTAVEIALKASFQYWRNTGNTKKTRFIHLGNAYHGETIGALSVSDVALYKATFGPLMLPSLCVESPDCYHRAAGESWQEYSTRQFAHMEATLKAHADEVAAVIIEPLVQCAGNMRMYDPSYLRLLREACTRHNVHLIADEIAVGFGRTGTLFACEQGPITPDFLCLSKGLTGGYLPLSAVLTTDTVYQAFYDDYHTLKGFLHSHSYTGNPLACRAALATLDIFQNEPVIENNRALAKQMQEATAHFVDHPNVSEVRQCGMILAIEMVKDKATKEPFPWQERRGLTIGRYALSQGVLLRPLGNVIYFMPPYVITPEQITHVATVAFAGMEKAVADSCA